MDVLIVGLNAKYIHTNLAIRNIVKYCDDPNVGYFEATVNDDMDGVLEDILNKRAMVVAFSCYIWNIEQVLYMAENIKKIAPKTVVVLGGPEVTYCAAQLMQRHSGIDYIIAGEGEEAFRRWVEAWKGKGDMSGIGGLIYRIGDNIVENPLSEPPDLNAIPLSYGIDEDLEHKLVYYETSRGCHFRCAFCFSSLDPGVREAQLYKVEKDLMFFTSKKVRTVKLVDRSFNSNLKRAKRLFDIIRSLPGDTVFHCEVNPELVNTEFIKALDGIEDRLQFEAGVQSTNPETLKAISRTSDVIRTLKGIELMCKAGLKLHADLIAGLPYEDFITFGKSYNDVYRLYPNEIQLGFLKMLKGTRLTKKARDYGICYRSKPPYEILYNDYITYDELSVLKGIAELTDKYYNSGRFAMTLKHLEQNFQSPFDFYRSLYDFWKGKGLLRERHSQKNLYDILYSYACYLGEDEQLIQDLLKFDFLSSMGKDALPVSIARVETAEFLKRGKEHMQDQNWVRANFPEATGLSWGEMSRYAVFGLFRYDIFNAKSPKKHGIAFLNMGGKPRFAAFDL